MHMDPIMQSSIFFIITSVAVVVLTIAVLSILIYILKIVKDIRAISKMVRDGSEALSGDVAEVESQLKEKGVLNGVLLAVATAIVGAVQVRKSTKRKK